MSLPGGGSTQPFSDSAEVQRRVEQARAEHRDGKVRSGGASETGSVRPVPEPGPDRQRREQPTTEGTALSTPANLAIDDLTKAFADARLASSPDARLVLRYRPQPVETHSAVFRVPRNAEGWDMFAVVQRTKDVDFAINIPFYNPPYDPPPPRFIPYHLECRIYYNPASDNCLVVIRSTVNTYLTGLDPIVSRKRVVHNQGDAVTPGLWRISVGGDGAMVEQHLIDFLILQRQFSVTIHEALASSSTNAKRPASGDEDLAIKRRRGEEDMTEIVLAPTALPLPGWQIPGGGDPGIITAPVFATTPARPIRTQGTPLLDLVNGELAIIRTSDSPNAEKNHISFLETPGDAQSAGPSSYELRRLERIAVTRSATLFAGQHSALSERIVAKIIKYEARTVKDLVSCATAWKREKTILERLNHKNIISLKAFDGRLFAIYVERLPPSLNRGTNSPFQASDAYTILRDISSALTYLATQQIIHNDIKPGNIAYSPQRGAVLLDFGLATPSTGQPVLGGTPWYIPPELIFDKTGNPSRDVWALGVTMLYVLRKVRLPEMATKAWAIRDVVDPESDGARRMAAWVDSVVRDKEQLDRADTVQCLVYRMLERDGQSRIRAAEITSVSEESGQALLKDAPL